MGYDTQNASKVAEEQKKSSDIDFTPVNEEIDITQLGKHTDIPVVIRPSSNTGVIETLNLGQNAGFANNLFFNHKH